MKIRSGYVSNSSSSSFIIAVKKELCVVCPTCGRKDPDFIDYVEKHSNDICGDETRVKAIGSEKIIDYIRDNWYSYDDSSEEEKKRKSLIKALKKAEKDGKRVALVEIAYHYEDVNEEYQIQLNNGSIEKLWSDHS
jgi:hypothetical protein